MPRNKQRLGKVFTSAGVLKRSVGGPEHGHSQLIVTVENDPYPVGEFPDPSLRCKGCGQSWADLQAAGFNPPCSKPAESITVIIEYASDPMNNPFENQAIQNGLPAELGALEALPERSNGIVVMPLKAAEDEVLIPSDEELESMDPAELDALYNRVIQRQRELENGKSQ